MSLPEDLHHPRIRAPVPPGLPVEGQTGPDRVRQGDGSYFRKPEGFEEGVDPLPPLKRLRSPE